MDSSPLTIYPPVSSSSHHQLLNRGLLNPALYLYAQYTNASSAVPYSDYIQRSAN